MDGAQARAARPGSRRPLRGIGVQVPGYTSNRNFRGALRNKSDRLSICGLARAGPARRAWRPGSWKKGVRMFGTASAPKKRTALLSLFVCLVLAFAVSGCPGTTAATDAGSAPAGSAAAASAEDAKMAVAVKVDSSAADGSVAYDETVELDEGATAYDALVATGLSINASDSQYGKYVEGIGGLAAYDFGDTSGWMFSVNGEDAQVSCDQLTLKDGDAVTFTYVTSFE